MIASRPVAHLRTRSPGTGGALPEIIPFDQAARFEITGKPGRVAEDVINIGSDGPFVAVAVGYGFKQERTAPLPIFTSPTAVVPGAITLAQLPAQALVQGFRVHPRSANILFQGEGELETFSTQTVSDQLANSCFELVERNADLSFLFSVIDSSSGRELQDEPVNNLASLGDSRGERPFRPLAQPLSFQPRSTLRVQIVEQTPDVHGTLFVVFYGYRVLVNSACPEGVAEALTAVARAAVGITDARVIPFDYVARVLLTGRPGNLIETEVTVSSDSAFVATAVGYGLAAEDDRVAIVRDDAGAAAVGTASAPAIDLAKLPLRALPPAALRDGIRIRPDYLRLVLAFNARLRTVPAGLAAAAFERLNRPGDVSFLYGFSDTGVGRDWQNRRLHNVAGLGIANGRRPFKALPRPRIFPPRSSLRVSVEEHTGSGMLFFAFQGYKVLAQRGGRS